MKITSVKGIQLRCPCEEIHDALSTSIARQAFLIRIETDKGIWGIGEAFPLELPSMHFRRCLISKLPPLSWKKKQKHRRALANHVLAYIGQWPPQSYYGHYFRR